MKIQNRQRTTSRLGIERLEQRELLAGLNDNGFQGIVIDDVDSPEITVEIDAPDGKAAVTIRSQPPGPKVETGQPVPNGGQQNNKQTGPINNSSGQPTITFRATKAGEFGVFDDPQPHQPGASSSPNQPTDEAIQSLYNDDSLNTSPVPDESALYETIRDFDMPHDPVRLPHLASLDAILAKEDLFPQQPDTKEGKNTSEETHANTGQEKLKSPQVDPFAGQDIKLQAAIDFYEGFNDPPKSFAAVWMTGLLMRGEALPYKPVAGLSNADLGQVAGALLWLRFRHPQIESLDVLQHYVRLEIRRRFGRLVLPLF